jgi:pyridoxamine 5'-phosphate oxidase
MIDPRDMRTEYGKGHLDDSSTLPEPIAQFGKWLEEAIAAKVPEPNSMIVATADAGGRPSARVMLLKGFDARGFVFYTNYDSRKGHDLDANPRAALVFFWEKLERQVRVEGSIARVSRQESGEYFHSRPRLAQIGAWVSKQSGVIQSRLELEKAAAKAVLKYAVGKVPLPDFWGGYRVVPDRMEFWQGRASRLHDRLQYSRQADETWTIQRLWP